MSAKSGKGREKRGGGFVFNSLSAIVICAALVLGVSVFFRVSSVEVSGAFRYSNEEIIAASGIREGANLVFLNRAAAEKKITDALVYVGKATVSRSLPNKVSIIIQESGTAACVETESGYWTIDSNCRLLEPCPVSEISNYIKVMGLSALSPKAGQKLEVSEEDKSKAGYLELLLEALSTAGMLESIDNIDLATSANPRFDYMGRFSVELGSSSDLDSKLALLTQPAERFISCLKFILYLSPK